MRKALGFLVLLMSIWGFIGQPGVLLRVDGLRGTAGGILRSPQSVLAVFSLPEKGSGEATAPLADTRASKEEAKQPEKPSAWSKAGETKKSADRKSPSKAAGQEKPGAEEKETGNDIQVGTKKLKEWEQAAFDAVNAERKKLGLEPFEWDEEAAKICRLRAKEMFECHIFDHYSPVSEKAIPQYFSKDLLESIQPAAECIAGVYAKNKSHLLCRDGMVLVAQSWYESPKHREILVDPSLKKGAIGIALSEEPIDIRFIAFARVTKVEPMVSIMCFIGRP